MEGGTVQVLYSEGLKTVMVICIQCQPLAKCSRRCVLYDVGARTYVRNCDVSLICGKIFRTNQKAAFPQVS